MTESTEYRVAQRIREIRKYRNMTLQQVSQRAGLSKGLLSKVENCVVSPPIATLTKLAQALDVSIGDFFESDDKGAEAVFFPNGKRRSARRRRGSNYTYELLAPGRRWRDMQPMIVSIDGSTYKLALQDHSGYEFVFLLEGEMDYVVGDNVYHLQPEDCLYFNARLPHGPKLKSKQKARYIAVCTGT